MSAAVENGSGIAWLLYGMEHFAVAVAAISGVLAARGKHVDLFGVLVLAAVTAFGGGTVRDLLVGDFPVAWTRDPNLLATVSIAAVLTFLLARFAEFPGRLLLVADAFGLSLFTIIGAQKALNFHVAPSLAVVMGVVTGVAGGALRDVLTGEIPLVFRPQIHLYATAALLGGAVFVVLAHIPCCARSAVIAGVGVTLVLRLAAMRWKLVLPVFVTK